MGEVRIRELVTAVVQGAKDGVRMNTELTRLAREDWGVDRVGLEDAVDEMEGRGEIESVYVQKVGRVLYPAGSAPVKEKERSDRLRKQAEEHLAIGPLPDMELGDGGAVLTRKDVRELRKLGMGCMDVREWSLAEGPETWLGMGVMVFLSVRAGGWVVVRLGPNGMRQSWGPMSPRKGMAELKQLLAQVRRWKWAEPTS